MDYSRRLAQIRQNANKTPLQKHYIKDRHSFAKKHVHCRELFHHVIFYDEKIFNLDEPDGFNYYWRDPRKERKKLSSRRWRDIEESCQK